MKNLFLLMRPKQWVKNLFVLAPLLFSGLYQQPEAVFSAITAMLLFCIASSLTYIFNDYRDIESDRLHHIKSKVRPFAAGTVSKRHGFYLAIVLCALLFAGYFIQPQVLHIIFIYLAVNLAYSLWVKNQPVVDIFSIASGFVLRVYAGGSALHVPVSSWMFVCTLCLALYLASIKRRQELQLVVNSSRKVLGSYSIQLVDRYAEMSGTGALLFYSLYVMSERPQLIVSIPLVIFGFFRYWYLVDRQAKGESPTDTLLSDWPLIFAIITWLGITAWLLKA